MRDAEALRQRLLHVPGVKKVNIVGEQSERIYVEFSHERLATLGISPQDVFAALNNQNVLTPAGSVETQGPQVFIRIDGAFDALQKIRDTPIVAQGRTVKLSDIATVQCGYEDPRPSSSATVRSLPCCWASSCATAGTGWTWARRWTGRWAPSTQTCRWAWA